MKCKFKKDVLLIARPDHSYKIYQALSNDRKLSFLYISFGLFPMWTKRLITNRRLRFVSGNCVIDPLITVALILKSKLGVRFIQIQPLFRLFQRLVGILLSKYKPKIIHYWPFMCYKQVFNYNKRYDDVFTVADVYHPYDGYVMELMKPVYEKYNLDCNHFEERQKEYERILRNENNLLVPSFFVQKSYQKIFPDKNYIRVPYGITISSIYKKKSYKMQDEEISSFVYLGSISIEKGIDLLLEYFSQSQKYILHLFGAVKQEQSCIFENYKKCSNIIFHGTIPHEELQYELCKYDVGIHLSRFDAYSLAVGEIIGCGIPVVVSTSTGISDEVSRYGFGVVTDLDFESIDQAVKNVVTIENYNRYIVNIDDYIKSNPESYTDKILKLYKSKI